MTETKETRRIKRLIQFLEQVIERIMRTEMRGRGVWMDLLVFGSGMGRMELQV